MVGQDVGEKVARPLTITDFVRYQGASGDMNPIHHDAEFARKAGYDQPFAVGMRQAGVMASYSAELFGPENVRRFKVQFREQAWPGDIITYKATVAGKRVEHGVGLIDLDLLAERQTGGVHLKGWATFAIPVET
ncbi:dehydratase [Sphingomonas sp. Root50]|nr:dehydratase [Sphingomonas sp. Root1294]KQY65917.1 dehydratase [Sphingomonas sp. Root50]KRB95516.1 dehydratase [Sphingomonas sp. Root720]